MTTDDHPAVKALHETLSKLPDACDDECVEEVRKVRKKLRKRRRELKHEVNEMLSREGMEIEDPESVDLLEDEHPVLDEPIEPELV